MLAVGPSRANVAPLATVTHAERAHVGTAMASIGSTIYEGDQLSTDAGGVLRIVGSTITLQLDAQSALVVRNSLNLQNAINAELLSGTLVFSTRTGNIVVAANGAFIRPAIPAATMAHVRVVNQKELRIYAQRGALEFSYRDEREVIAEGKSYRILLDPSKRDSAAISEANRDINKPPARQRFLLIAIAVAAAITIPVLVRALESPDRP